ncbi:FAD-dependent oxidoreductase [Streptomyces atriruber]|uniref:FAD-dependent oxidoreductase n=1 Tax=Streptomyces atriruber TaxID=545121 RepID=A0ABV3BSZ9_9ACTN
MSGVVVVGAGVTGASVAYHLASRGGVPVTLLEQGSGPAAGVTADSFGWVSGAGGDWPGGGEDLRGYVLADYRRLEGELPHVAVRRTGSLNWVDGAGEESREVPGRVRVGRSDIAALEPALRNPPDQAVHTPGDIGVDAPALTGALVAAAEAHGAIVLYETDVTSLRRAGGSGGSGGRVEGVMSSTGFHAAATVVLTAGTGVPELCKPLPVDLPVAVSPATLVRIAAPPGLVRNIVAGPGFEVREARDGELLLPLSHEGRAAPGAEVAHDVLRRFRANFRGSDQCRLLGHRTARRPIPVHGPLIGYATHDRSVYVAVMHSAVTLAPTVGRLVADELVSGRPTPELRRCRPRIH